MYTQYHRGPWTADQAKDKSKYYMDAFLSGRVCQNVPIPGNTGETMQNNPAKLPDVTAYTNSNQ